MASRPVLAISGVVCAIGAYILANRRRQNSLLPLPPGLPKLPLIGNLLDLPKSEEWVTYQRWCRELDTDVLHLEVVGKSIVIINSLDVALELLEKRSYYYSGRPYMVMAADLMGWRATTALLPYGDEWRTQRRFLHSSLSSTEAKRLHPHEIRGTHNLLRRLLKQPDNIMRHLRHWAGDIVISATYGIDVQEENDPYIAAAETAVRAFFAATVPGAYLVDTFPLLKYVPKWMPGAGFKRKAEEWRKQKEITFNDPFLETQRRMANGDHTPSFTSLSLQRVQEGKEEFQKEAIMNAAGSMFGAASDTTVSAVASCILAMLENPAILRKAQDQIDRIVGNGRLPSFADEEDLPYITAMAKECLRWRAIAPIAVPHLAEKDDTYNGYQIPAKSIIIANVWAMLHDEEVYPDPLTFNPERFLNDDGVLNPSVLDPAQIAFGFGRRICPGRYMAFSSIWIALATLVATFNLKKAIDSDGNEVPLSHEYIAGLAVIPAPFECSITPRSAAAEALIRDTTVEESRA